MWFKQAQIFKLLAPLPSDPNALEEELSTLEFKPCLPRLPFSYGWVSPMDQEEAPLVHSNNGYLLLCMQLEEKILPAVVVRQALNEKIKDIEKKQSRKVTQKEKYALKDEMTQTLLPRAFSKLSRIYAFIDTKNHWLVVDTTTSFKVEKLLALFKKTLSQVSYHAIETKKIAPLLTRWLSKDDCPRSLFIEKSCVLRDPNQQSRIIRCQQQDLSASSIQSLLQDGYEVHQLSLNWQAKIDFLLVDDFSLKNIKYNDALLDAEKEQYNEMAAQQFDTDFYLMTQYLSELLTVLLEIFSKDNIKNDRKKTLEVLME